MQLALAGILVVAAVATGLALRTIGKAAGRTAAFERGTTVRGEVLVLLPRAADGDETALRRLADHFRERESALATLGAALDIAAGDPVIARSLSRQLSRLAGVREVLATLMAAPDASLRRLAADAAETLRLRWMVPSLLAAADDNDPVVRVAVCRALAITDPDLASGVLARRLDCGDAWASALLESTVARLGSSAAGALVSRANAGGPSAGVLRALAHSDHDLTGPMLHKALTDQDPDVRLQAARALPRQTEEGGSDATDRLLLDADEQVRLAAVHSVDPQRRRGVLSLTAALGDPSRVVRFAAAHALSASGPGREALAAASSAPDPSVAEAASAALWADDEAAPGTTRRPLTTPDDRPMTARIGATGGRTAVA